MNNRFKFRIWDIKQQKYRQRTHHEADVCLNCLTGKVLFGEGIEIYGEEDDKDVILEQCTGTKDKNGKLVYEGDFIKTTNGTIGYIVWSQKDLAFMTKDLNHKEKEVYLVECEVIGNIHENADLLEN